MVHGMVWQDARLTSQARLSEGGYGRVPCRVVLQYTHTFHTTHLPGAVYHVLVSLTHGRRAPAAAACASPSAACSTSTCGCGPRRLLPQEGLRLRQPGTEPSPAVPTGGAEAAQRMSGWPGCCKATVQLASAACGCSTCRSETARAGWRCRRQWTTLPTWLSR